jgi:hypothetical protein
MAYCESHREEAAKRIPGENRSSKVALHIHHTDWKAVDTHWCTKVHAWPKQYLEKPECIALAKECPGQARVNVSSYAYFISNIGLLVDHGRLIWPREGLSQGGGGGGGDGKDCVQQVDDPVSECIQIFPGYGN